MKKKKKNFVLIINSLICLLVFSACMTVNAETEEEYFVWVNGIQVTDSNKNDVLGDLDGNEATVIFIPASGDKEAKLILNDAIIYEGHYDQVRTTFSAIQSEIDMTVEVKGNNFLGRYSGEESGVDRDLSKYSVDYGILDEHKNLKFTGDGSLTIIDKTDGILATDITFDKNFGTLTIEDDGRAVLLPPCAISAGGTVTINGGNFYLTSIDKNGITANNKVIINNGFINIKTASDKNAIISSGGIIIDNNMEVINAEYKEGITKELLVTDLDTNDGLVTIKKRSYLVRFNTNGGSTINNVTVTANDKVVKPTDPTKENYVFDGWYEDETLNRVFDFNTPITENIILYAGWSEENILTDNIEKNPNTGDNIVLYSIIGSLSLIGIILSSLYLNYKNFN